MCCKNDCGKVPFHESRSPRSFLCEYYPIIHCHFLFNFLNSCIQGVIIQSLINRFKEIRHQSKPPRDSTTKDPQIPATSHKVTKPSGIEKPCIPTGEDEMSFAQHNQVFKY